MFSPFHLSGGQVFIVAFTQMAVNEERARLEVERLVERTGHGLQAPA
jgi:hypothetical protein